MKERTFANNHWEYFGLYRSFGCPVDFPVSSVYLKNMMKRVRSEKDLIIPLLGQKFIVITYVITLVDYYVPTLVDY